jgi:hypothetical protein
VTVTAQSHFRRWWSSSARRNKYLGPVRFFHGDTEEAVHVGGSVLRSVSLPLTQPHSSSTHTQPLSLSLSSPACLHAAGIIVIDDRVGCGRRDLAGVCGSSGDVQGEGGKGQTWCGCGCVWLIHCVGGGCWDAPPPPPPPSSHRSIPIAQYRHRQYSHNYPIDPARYSQVEPSGLKRGLVA